MVLYNFNPVLTPTPFPIGALLLFENAQNRFIGHNIIALADNPWAIGTVGFSSIRNAQIALNIKKGRAGSP